MIMHDVRALGCRRYLKTKMSAPTARVSRMVRHTLTLEACEATRGRPAPSSLDTLPDACSNMKTNR